MAEAHQAVAFQFAITDEGISVHCDREAVKSALKSFFGIYKRHYFQAKNTLLKGVYPASPVSLLVILFAVVSLYFCGVDPTWGMMNWLTAPARWVGCDEVYSAWGALLGQSVFLWLVLSYMQQYTLMGLLMYKGWMFDPRGKRSLTTKVWALLVKFVTGPFQPLLLSYQRSLPRLPVPRLEDTCRRYLETVRPLLNDKDYQEMERLVEDFKNGPGKKMQRYLYLKSWWATNYVTDWWDLYVYLYGRSSIMINSNYYGSDAMSKPLTSIPAARIGMMTYILMCLKKDIETEKLKPLVINGLVPLCSAQYDKLFGTTRLPGQERDKLVHFGGKESRHAVVHNKGRWYKVPLYNKNRMLEAVEIEWQMQQILDDDTGTVGPGEEHLAALTAHDRVSWAVAREQYFSKGVNRQSMEMIEKAAFVLFFDDSSPDMLNKDDDGEGLTAYAKNLFHGNGYDRWFDKSLSAVMFANAHFGINAEHSWADAPIIGYLLEYCCNLEHIIRYRPDGHCHGDIQTIPPKPQRMKWEIPPQAVSRIEAALSFARKQIEDIDLYVLEHSAFGKGVMKKLKMSPDAFIQMALQLTYYKDAGHKLCLTYEASMTRLYREGRTETVRPVTMESAAFVRAMCNPNSTDEERKHLLHQAVEKHTHAYKLAMTGQGIDRHLFCLYVMSKYLKMESPFLAKVLGEPWKLSTSQTPTQQTGKLDYHKNPEKITSGGGFGPVTKDGYGVSYIIPGDEVIYFHVSSFKSCDQTDSHRFARGIRESLRDMRDMFDDGH